MAIDTGHFMAYNMVNMVVPVTCLGPLEPTTMFTCSRKTNQTCAHVLIESDGKKTFSAASTPQEHSSNRLFPAAILYSKTLSIVLSGRGWKLLHATSANKHRRANNVLTVKFL